MKTDRQDTILDIINSRRIATQQELAEELAQRGIGATQSSVSRDIVELGLTKIKGRYTAPQPALDGGPVVGIERSGDNLIVIKTGVGQANPAAILIDRAKIEEVIGTVAGDDTILVAVKDLDAQRMAMRKIIKLFAPPSASAGGARKRAARPSARTV
jgi:transcriptional regulator of arginine metabolism